MATNFDARQPNLREQLISPPVIDPEANFRQELINLAVQQAPNLSTSPNDAPENIRAEKLFDEETSSHFPPLNTTQFMYTIHSLFDAVDTLHRVWMPQEHAKPMEFTLIHGSICPENIVVLTDTASTIVGMTLLNAGQSSFVNAPLPAAATNQAYTAPEVKSRVDVATVKQDVFSLGCVINDILTRTSVSALKSVRGRRAFELKTSTFDTEEIDTHSVPPAVITAIKHALEPDPRQRTANVREFWDELQKGWLTAFGKIDVTFSSDTRE